MRNRISTFISDKNAVQRTIPTVLLAAVLLFAVAMMRQKFHGPDWYSRTAALIAIAVIVAAAGIIAAHMFTRHRTAGGGTVQ